MINKSKIIAFAATGNPDEARRFYGQSLGLELVSEDPFALVFNANGNMLRIQKVKESKPPPYTVLGWEVADIAAEIDALAKKGVKMARYRGLDQDEKGIWVAPSGGKIAWFEDPDGNTLSLTQFGASS